jgi:fumarate hydratase class I
MTREQSPAAKDAIAQILTNSKMSAIGHRPICQDTGIVNVFLKIGMDVQLGRLHGQAWKTPSTKACAAATTTPTTCLRAIGRCRPAVRPQEHAGQHARGDLHANSCPATNWTSPWQPKAVAARTKSKMVMLNPSDSVVDWVLKTVPTMGAGWCPPGMLGIGIGGTAEKAVLMAKESLMDDLDMYQLLAKSSQGRKADAS